MTLAWINVKLKLIDPEHQKPDRRRNFLIGPTVGMDELLLTLRKIEQLINEGYVIEEMDVDFG